MFAPAIPRRFLGLLLLLSGCSPKYHVDVTVKAPPHTSRVVMVGNTAELGNWDPAEAPRLEQDSDTTFQVTLVIRQPQIEYKFTRGSWETEALQADSSIPGNYSANLSPQTTLAHSIPLWRDDIGPLSVDRLKGITGTVEVYDSVYSPQLDNYRTVTVWLPPSYYGTSYNHYPVLYLQDGQNVFSSALSLSHEEWALDETAMDLINRGQMAEIIMVAIDHGADRTGEYSPAHRGNDYSAFLIRTVKPWIDTTYRTRPGAEHTAVMGSSMGGIIAFHLAWEYPNVFGMAAGLSPAFLVDDSEIVRRVQTGSLPDPRPFFIIYNGTEELEARLQPAITALVEALESRGFDRDRDFRYQIFTGALHTEAAWAEQSRSVLLAFFGNKK
ncbi:MAG: alpha/beta hydrolase-fold protein [Fidelibacterota bacterium]